MRTNLYLSPSVRSRLKAYHERTKIPMSAFATRVLDLALSKEEVKAQLKGAKRNA